MHYQGIRSQNPKTKDSRIRERMKIGLEAAYHKINTKIRVKRFRARQRLAEMTKRKKITSREAEEELRKREAEIEAEKMKLKR